MDEGRALLVPFCSPDPEQDINPPHLGFHLLAPILKIENFPGGDNLWAF